MVNRQSCSQWWQQDHTNAQPCMCIKTTLMHLKKNIKAPFGIRRGFFFLFPAFSLQNFYTIPVKFLCSKGALRIERSSMLKILNLCKTYDLWTCTQTKITVLDIYTALKMNNTRWLCLCLRKKHLVNVNVQLGGCTEKTSGKCKPKGCSIKLSRAAIVNLCRLLVPYGNDKIVKYSTAEIHFILCSKRTLYAALRLRHVEKFSEFYTFKRAMFTRKAHEIIWLPWEFHVKGALDSSSRSS
jgi:hypothetical protein